MFSWTFRYPRKRVTTFEITIGLKSLMRINYYCKISTKLQQKWIEG